MTSARIGVFTIAALVGFSASSLLCRVAIGAGELDPATFTAIRLASGALVLAILVRLARSGETTRSRSPRTTSCDRSRWS